MHGLSGKTPAKNLHFEKQTNKTAKYKTDELAVTKVRNLTTQKILHLLLSTLHSCVQCLGMLADFCIYVSGLEWVDIQHRTLSGIVTSVFWSFGNMLLALIAYLVRDWRWLLVAATLPCAVGMLSTWWVKLTHASSH